MLHEGGYWKLTYTDPTVLRPDVSLMGSHCYQLATLVSHDYHCTSGHIVHDGFRYVPIDRIVWA